MAQGMGFGSTGYTRSFGNNNKRLIAVVGFVVMSALAIGVPLLNKPKAVVASVSPEVVLPTPIPMVSVFMPVQRIAAGTQLSPIMFRVEGMSPVSVAALGGQPIKAESELVGKFAKVLIMPGRPIMTDQLMDAPDNQITRKIRPGYRAVTVEVDNVSGIEGWGVPGTKVDVLWQSEIPGEDMLVTTIVKNVQILSVAGKSDPAAFGGPSAAAPPAAMQKGLPVPPAGGNSPVGDANFTVTLLVTPDDGQKVFLASRSGKLSLMLRGDFEGAGDPASGTAVTTRRVMQGTSQKKTDRVEGVAKARRADGSFEEWSVIEGRVWRWGEAQNGAAWGQ